MRNVRVIYAKRGRLKFISHLDMNRYMTRLIKISGIPAWHTEGFNRHLYLTFALPLSLGVTCDYDVLDLKITDDAYTDEQAADALQKNAAEGLEIISVGPPVMKVADLTYAAYTLTCKDMDTDLLESFEKMFSAENIPVQKKGKKDKVSEINLAEKIVRKESRISDGELTVNLVLPAGNHENINPSLFLQSFCESGKRRPEVCLINRDMMYNADMEIFQ